MPPVASFGVHHLGRPGAHHALDGQTYSPRVPWAISHASRESLGSKNDLGQAVAVAQVDEDDAAVVAHRVHPAAQMYALPDMGRAAIRRRYGNASW
jgi:hypothetical protein